MATLKLDDLLGKKKEAPQVLDLSRSTVQSKEEFERLLDKVPEYKIRPEKVSLIWKIFLCIMTFIWLILWKSFCNRELEILMHNRELNNLKSLSSIFGWSNQEGWDEQGMQNMWRRRKMYTGIWLVNLMERATWKS